VHAAISPMSTHLPVNSDMYGVDMSRPNAQASTIRYSSYTPNGAWITSRRMTSRRPAHREEIAALHRAIQKTGRPIVLSYLRTAMVKDIEFLRENATCGGSPTTLDDGGCCGRTLS